MSFFTDFLRQTSMMLLVIWKNWNNLANWSVSSKEISSSNNTVFSKQSNSRCTRTAWQEKEEIVSLKCTPDTVWIFTLCQVTQAKRKLRPLLSVKQCSYCGKHFSFKLYWEERKCLNLIKRCDYFVCEIQTVISHIFHWSQLQFQVVTSFLNFLK